MLVHFKEPSTYSVRVEGGPPVKDADRHATDFTTALFKKSNDGILASWFREDFLDITQLSKELKNDDDIFGVAFFTALPTIEAMENIQGMTHFDYLVAKEFYRCTEFAFFYYDLFTSKRNMLTVQNTKYFEYLLANLQIGYREYTPSFLAWGTLLFTRQFLIKTPAIVPNPWQLLFQFPSSPFMDKLDNLNNFIMEFLIVIVTFVLVWLYFLLSRFTYSIKSVDDPFPKIVQIQHNSFLEFIWTVIPFLILLVIFSSSAALIYDGANKTNIVNTIKVIGNQWYWKYSYSTVTTISSIPFSFYPPLWDFYFKKRTLDSINIEHDAYMDQLRPFTYLREDSIGGEIIDMDLVRHDNFKRLFWTDYQLFIPAKEWLRFLISSADVIHSWALPAFGIKCDAVPGRINEVISLVSIGGEYFGQCSELCGVNHGFMPIHIWAYAIPKGSDASLLSLKKLTGFF